MSISACDTRAHSRLVRGCGWLAASLCCAISGAAQDASRLPPPARGPIEFGRDIQPLLAGHCLKCHSDEKPKNGFHLTSREAALKGGDNGVDIIPGQSARSPLIQYVAGLVPDMQMPPEGRGTPLTPEEIGRLRAWIDQGAVWGPSTNETALEVTAPPTAGWTTVRGDEHKFRELYWQREGWNGGLEDFSLVDKPGPDSKVTAAGHVLLDDYRVTLTAEKNNLGFTRFGWTQLRKYYDDSGGYYPLFTQPIFSLNRDLHLDDGRAWIDLGLTPPRWPRVVLGYEYQYRDGTEATLAWGPIRTATESRNIFPALKDLSEHTHILKFDADYELAGWTFSDSFRGEWYSLEDRRVNESGSVLGSPGMALTTATETDRHFQGANTVHLENQLTDWLFASGGYLYSKLDADGSLGVETLDPAFLNPAAPAAPGWQAEQIELTRESHVFSVSSLLGPFQGLSLSLGTQNEWTRQSGLGQASVNIAVPFAPFIFPVDPAESVFSGIDRRIFTQDAGLRFTKIPFTTLFAEARFQQEDLGEYQEEQSGLTPFLRKTDSEARLNEFRGGFNTSPSRRVSLTAQYRRQDKATDYDNRLKEVLGRPFEGYPGFIRRRELLAEQAEGKVAWQTTAWLKTSVSYQWVGNRYRTDTDPAADPIAGLAGGISSGGKLLAGTYDSHVASFTATLTPWRRLFLSATLAYQNARTRAAANGDASVAPYAGDIYTVLVSGDYALDDKTDLLASYTGSLADFSQDNLAAGLPLGIQYRQHAVQVAIKRQLAPGRTLALQYRFYGYDEPSAGGFNDFQAHAVFATLTLRWP